MNDGFTPEQKLAIATDGNVIVSAGAGSGKTTVMIERIINKLEKGAKLEQMLIVTFTRASAADIKVKLVKKLNELKKTKPGLARAALEVLPVANIGTLHSFCQRLVKTYFYVADADPSATVCEDGEASVYKRAAVRAAIDEALATDDRYVRELYAALSNRRGDADFAAAVESAVDYALSMPDPDGYLGRDRSDDEALRELIEHLKKTREVLTKRSQRLIEWAHALRATAHERNCRLLIDAISGKCEFDAIKNIGGKKTGEAESLNDDYKILKSECKEFIELCDTVRAAKNRDSAPYSRALRMIAASAKDKYAAKKAALGKLDYSDLEHGAKKVLSDDKCKSELAQKIKYVFIDEFQDINPLQANIADELESMGAEMFLVGDAKQSIYGFRRCSPEHFIKKSKSASDVRDADSREKGDYAEIVLNKNFRSSPEVIGFVNDVFTGLMYEDYGGVDYETQPLVAGLDRAGAAELCYVEPTPVESDDTRSSGIYSVVDAEEKTDLDAEAKYVAERITEYMCGDGQKFSDIAVLVRGMGTKFCSDLKIVFERCGIPAHFGKNPKLSDCPEAVALLDILRCADNRYDDLALYTALRSPMGAFSDGELAAIAREGGMRVRRDPTEKKRVCFWQKVEAYRGELKPRLDAFKRSREKFSAFALSHDAAETLGYITSEMGYFQYVYENFGDDAAGNVQSLINSATGYDPHMFIKHCDDTDPELAVPLGGDAVSVMTMHGSKGLEFGLCIVADVAHKFNMSDATDRVIVSDGGVSVKVPDAAAKTLEPSLPWLAEHIKLPNKFEQEEMRLLYVALTRAKRTLVVTAKQNAKTKRTSMLKFLSGNDSLGAATVAPRELPEKRRTTEDIPSEEVENAVKAKCDFEYGFVDHAVKCSVTALSDSHGDDESAFVPVIFDGDDGKTVALDASGDGRARGTMYHKAMELIDFSNPDYAVLDASDSTAVDRAVIERAVEKMRVLTEGATHVFKERYFIADLAVETEAGGKNRTVNTLVQGVIDLLILDGAGNATIVDYKTTKLESLFTDGYKKQLRLYASAVEKSTGLKVTHTYLYSFVNNTLYAVNL